MPRDACPPAAPRGARSLARRAALPAAPLRVALSLGLAVWALPPQGAAAQQLRGGLDTPVVDVSLASGPGGTQGGVALGDRALGGVSVGTGTSGAGTPGGIGVGVTGPGGLLGTTVTAGPNGVGVSTGLGGVVGVDLGLGTAGGLPGAGTPAPGGTVAVGGGGTAGGTGVGADAITALTLRLTRAIETIPVRGNDALGRGVPAAPGNDSLAAGYGSRAAGVGATAVGPGASADGPASVAVGTGASAGQANTLALGAGARTVRDGQVAVGTARSTYTLPGIVSAASQAAQTGETRFVTTDGGGNLGASIYGPATIAGLGSRLDISEGRLSSAETRLGAVESRVGTVEARVDAVSRTAVVVRREARQGVAAAMAMTSASMPSAPGRTTWVANAATYRGEWAGGFALAHRLPTAVPLALTAGYAYGGDRSHGVRAGLGGEF